MKLGIQYYISLFLLLLVLCPSCSNEDILVPAEEPIIEEGGDETIIIGDIDVSIEEIKDIDLFLKWYPVNNVTSYEIVINDTMTIKDGIVMEDYLDYYYFRLANLTPNTTYKITLRAISKDLNVKTSIIQTKTKKSFVDQIITIPVDFQEYDPDIWSPFYKYINTSDGGAAIAGSLSKHGKTYTVLIKLTSSYNIEWICHMEGSPRFTPHEPTMDLIECFDKGFIVVNNLNVYKINNKGSTSWQISEFSNDYEGLSSVVELPDKSILLIGRSSKNWGQLNIGIEGLMVKLNPQGILVWKKYYHSSIENFFEKIILKPDGNLFIAGTKDINNANYETLSDIRKAICVIEINQNGDIIRELVYKYQNIPYDEYASLNNLISHDGYYYIIGRSHSSFDKTFLTKIDTKGNIIWQKRGDDDGEYSSNISLSGMGNKTLFIYSFIHSQVSILKEIDLNGNTIKEVEFRKFPSGYPNGIYCGQDKKGRFIYVTDGGQILFINLDGYRYE
ncbi:MAG: fibronectin type III domain-containing protein [Prevotella sp.]|jgi:hypothetical protein|nr:fibronectin type III domain-containing protein [Prevotella sp.]